ncbi:hypothetical protein AKJ09_03095 [Labilithrix luteola]|uniref:Uncharacterized protein n=1 Tax=Labilithrix luteola TaxID=1391654 RepID=A0A0K1PST6_9BACT|nr:hypothetical protein AKJ09_03095 [Labilithrix luteola]
MRVDEAARARGEVSSGPLVGHPGVAHIFCCHGFSSFATGVGVTPLSVHTVRLELEHCGLPI